MCIGQLWEWLSQFDIDHIARALNLPQHLSIYAFASKAGSWLMTSLFAIRCGNAHRRAGNFLPICVPATGDLVWATNTYLPACSSCTNSITMLLYSLQILAALKTSIFPWQIRIVLWVWAKSVCQMSIRHLHDFLKVDG